ncbi:hypothetical protein BDV37DRAFT_248955 [Aspergillus pseudonomiae]|uniref:Uncharacterized protein n=1 Tax=Aspergillus pseudonomiae TaxID=1506151 RepID=A0A5N7DCJ1_9EURO|nr:uncharacterized protein BDV37DRAFT_248955 [Aspergillus pseudonomiae]KAE8403875.1 hypothetical protein BDV37DRAFT_248955 [Aspergillus pseudonomiae]
MWLALIKAGCSIFLLSVLIPGSDTLHASFCPLVYLHRMTLFFYTWTNMNCLVSTIFVYLERSV